MKRYQILLLLSALVMLTVGSILPLLGQDETIITVSVPPWMNDLFNNELFESFEADHPGVKVLLAATENEEVYFGSPAYDLDEYLTEAEQRASSADILFIQSYSLTPHLTRTGFLLDLSPLVATDSELDVNDFYQPVWESFQWDGGLWGVPVTANLNVFVYDARRFDEAGLTYPDESWTMDDIAHAARELTLYDADGNVELPGFAGFNPTLLYRMFLGEPFYDSLEIPNPPRINNPDLVPLIETWIDLQEDFTPTGRYDFQAIPFTIGQSWQLAQPDPDGEHDWRLALLPGGVAGLEVQGFAVSAGTQYPELAYELAKSFTTNPEVVNRLFGNLPARRSMVGVEPEDQFFFGPELPEEAQAFIEEAIEAALPVSEMRYADYINIAIGKIQEEDLDTLSALEEAQAEAVESLQTAETWGQNTQIAVATPVPTPVISADQSVLKFGLTLFSTNIPNQDRWDQLKAEFLESHPRIGNIDIEMPAFTSGEEDPYAEFDCYYLPGNNVTNPQFDTSTILDLEPFMDADPSFDRSDVIGNILQQVQRDNRTWAYPVVVQPGIIWYDTGAFTDNAIPWPEGGWTIDAFNDALQVLKPVLDEGQAPLVPESFNDVYLLMLAAAYGGIPYDYRTEPPTLNLTDPAAVDALRQVLDLARNGYIAYQPLASQGGGGVFISGETVPIITDVLVPFSFRLQQRQDEENPAAQQMRLTTYPTGGQYTPVSYMVSTAYIRSTAQDPQACYDWISMIARHAELFSGIPVRHSLLNDPNLAATLGDDIVSFGQTFATQLDDPNIIEFPGPLGGGSTTPGAWIETAWVDRAFDNYVLEDGDLEAELAEAEANILTYRECTAEIPEMDPAQISTQEESITYARQFTDCAISIDPSLRDQYSFFYQDES